MVKAAIVIFQIVPLAAGVLALMLGALWLQVQDEKKPLPAVTRRTEAPLKHSPIIPEGGED